MIESIWLVLGQFCVALRDGVRIWMGGLVSGRLVYWGSSRSRCSAKKPPDQYKPTGGQAERHEACRKEDNKYIHT